MQFNLCREHNFGAIILTNTIDSNPFQYVEQCYKLVLPEVIKATAKAPAAADTAGVTMWGHTQHLGVVSKSSYAISSCR
jgi:hypothetical protein